MMKMGGSYAEPQNCIFVLAFCFLLYWSWPVVSCVKVMCSYDLRGMSAIDLKFEIYRIFDFYNDFFVRDGVLVESLPGLQVCGRDKDRGWSRKRVDALINEISEWRKCAVMLSKQIVAKLFRV